MHPLDHSLDENFHQPKLQRRRSSLDNSCLGAAQSSLLVFNADDSEGTRKRRLSLNNTTATIPTFLAEWSVRPKSKDLDMDWHESVHSRTSLMGEDSPTATAGGGSVMQNSMGSAKMSFGSVEGSESSLDDSDGDSFCDASAEEPANRIYLRKDLGASCFWSDDSMDECDVQDALCDQDHEKYHKDWPKPGDREKLPPRRVSSSPRRRKRTVNPIKRVFGKVVDKVIGGEPNKD